MKNPGGIATAASESDSRLLVGQLIGGQYRVKHLLGEGGMASVWAGSNERTGKRVALKVIRRRFMATPGADVFLRSEGLVASRVNHPNVVTVFDLIEHEGMACIVMELLDGVSLGSYIARNKPLSLRDAVGILLPAMHGVAAAHAQGVIHRDLKPQNVFVCVDADGRVVTTKVLDFGISMMMDWARGHSVAAMPGMLVGTPSYMAPEHIAGSTKLDPRTDVYGFGVLLYETLAGIPAFPGSPNVEEVLNRVQRQAAVPLREYRADLPMGIHNIVEMAIAKRPEERFDSLGQMMAALEEEVALLPPLAAGSSGVPVALMNYTVSGSVSVGVPSPVERETSEQYSTQTYGPARRDTDRAVPVQRMVEEPSRKVRAPIRTPATGVSSRRTGGLPITPSPKTVPTVLVARSGFVRVLLQGWGWLRGHRGFVWLLLAIAALIVARLAWEQVRRARALRPVVLPTATRPWAPKAVEPPPSPPSPPVPIEEDIEVFPAENLPPPPSFLSTPAAPRAPKPSKGHAAGDKGSGTRDNPEIQTVREEGDRSKAATETREQVAPAAETKEQAAPAAETKEQAAPANESTGQSPRRAGALKVDDF